MNKETYLPYAKHMFGGSEIDAVLNVLKDGWIARGPLVEKFENAVSEKFNYKSVCACSNGSTALDIVVNSLKLSSCDEVIVPTLSWPATASCVKLAGAKVVFADIDPDTYCISLSSIKSKLTSNTSAIIVCHFAGHPCDMDAIWDLAERNNVVVVEDAAHAFGGKYLNGQSIGSSERSYASTFSFHPAKNMTTAEGGLIVTTNTKLGSDFKVYRSGGVNRKSSDGIAKAMYSVDHISSNYHMSELHAALGLAQLTYIDNFLDCRRDITNLYQIEFESIQNTLIKLPAQCDFSANNLFVIQSLAMSNEDLIHSLNSIGIGAYYHYPLLHKENLVFEISLETLPVAEDYSLKAVSLPLGPHLQLQDAKRVINGVKNILAATL